MYMTGMTYVRMSDPQHDSRLGSYLPRASPLLTLLRRDSVLGHGSAGQEGCLEISRKGHHCHGLSSTYLTT